MIHDARGRLCFFSSDSYGLAHVMRNARIANETVAGSEALSALVITGVGTDTMYELADGCDYLRLPAILRLKDGEHRCVRLRMPWEELRTLRTRILCEVVPQFGPDVLVVDHLSRNIHSEIAPLLRELALLEAPPYRILAFNDILNHPDVVEDRWVRTGLFDFAAECFDEVWIYGEADVYDWRAEYGLPEAFSERVRHMGYLSHAVGASQAAIRGAGARNRYGIAQDRSMMLVTAGGGHDGGAMIDAYLTMLEAGRLRGIVSFLIPGPLMPTTDLIALESRAAALDPECVVMRRFVPDMEDVLLAADAVISMGGCTATEILAAGKASGLVPRHRWSSSQQVRASLMAKRGWATLLPIDTYSSARLEGVLQDLLQSSPVRPLPPFRGLDQTASRLRKLSAPTAP